MEQQPQWVPKSYTVVAAVKPATKWMASVTKAADGGEMTPNTEKFPVLPLMWIYFILLRIIKARLQRSLCSAAKSNAV